MARLSYIALVVLGLGFPGAAAFRQPPEQPPTPTQAPQPQLSPAPSAPEPDKPPADSSAHEPGKAPAEPPAAQTPVPPPDDLPEVTVSLKSGQSITGLLISQDDSTVIVRVGGIESRFSRDDVARVRTLPPVMDRYLEMRQAAGDDPDQIIRMAEWLQAREKYELALLEADRAVKLSPNHEGARRLRLLLTKQVELRARSKQGTDSTQPPAESTKKERPATRSFPLLSDAQINLIKVYEIDLAHAPQLVIKRDTITQLLKRYAGHPLIPVTQEGRDAIYRKSEKEVLELMFRLQARELYSQVRVLDQPESMRLFRDSVHRVWLMNSCATTACHGGEDAGRLMLFSRRPNSDASVYTNFLILDRHTLDNGTPLINYDAPDRSPLLQMALPKADSLFPHPAIPSGVSGRDGWKPVFRSSDDRRFKQAVEWIKAMYRPHPTYPIDYAPPGLSVPAAAPGIPGPPNQNPAATSPAPLPSPSTPPVETPAPAGPMQPPPR